MKEPNMRYSYLSDKDYRMSLKAQLIACFMIGLILGLTLGVML